MTHDQTSVTVQWIAPTSDGDSDITSYVLYAKADFESSFTQVYSGMTLSQKVSNLKTGFFYQFKVKALNVMGSSEISAASTAVITALVPSTPTGLTLQSRSADNLVFTWQQPGDKGGVELSGYNIYVSQGFNLFSQILNAPASLNPTITVHTQNNLVHGQTYHFKVSAVNEIGESEYSPEIFVIASDMPKAPANGPTITLITETSISLSVPPLPLADNGGSPVTGYII